MKTSAILLAFAVVAAVPCGAGSSPAARRDEALQKIEACLRRNEVASRQCKHLNRNIQILVDTYRDGDKSVLPVLLKFTYLTDFYDEALLSDPEGFLATVQQLPEKEQREVAVGIAGRYFRPVPKTQFVALRSLLTSVPESSPLRSLAQECLKQLETNNASLFVDYFPPQTFAGPTAAFDIFWYSRELYALGEKPMWPVGSPGITTFRFTHLGSFFGPKSASLTVLPDGSGMVRIKALNPRQDKLEMDDSRTVSAAQVNQFFSAQAKANFWRLPAEKPSDGEDGAEWILEGVQNGQYHIVSRWCPATQTRDPQALAFADAARLLLEFSGHKYNGDC